MKKILITIALLLSSFTFAGVKVVGNGGDAVVCYTDATKTIVTSVQMFDYWEQAQVNNYGSVDLGGSQLSVREKIILATNRIAKFDPNLAEFVNKVALSLADNISLYLVTNSTLPDIQDMTPEIIPNQPNCYIEQFAIQYKDAQAGQRRFYISDHLYNQTITTNDSRAGLLLHEAIYRYAILKMNAENSNGIRFFNYLIETTTLENLDLSRLSRYINFLRLAELFNDKMCSLYLDIYLETQRYYGHGYDNKVCYNHIIKRENLSVFIPANSIYKAVNNSETEDFILPFNWNNNPLFQISMTDPLLGISVYKVNQLHFFSLNTQKFLFTKINTILSGQLPKMFGPLYKFYECSEFEMNLKTQELYKCQQNDASSNFTYFEKSRNPSLWPNVYNITPKENVNLPVLGSTKGFSLNTSFFIPDSIDKTMTTIAVDSNLNLIQGSILTSPNLQTQIEVNGFQYNLYWFTVLNSNGIYTLKAQTREKNFTNPKHFNFRLTMSDGGYDNVRFFCAANGYNNGGSILGTHNEYIGGSSERFFNLQQSTVVDKVDEDVKVIDLIICHRTDIETTQY